MTVASAKFLYVLNFCETKGIDPVEQDFPLMGNSLSPSNSASTILILPVLSKSEAYMSVGFLTEAWYFVFVPKFVTM